MLRTLTIVLLASAINANSFQPNGFLSRLMTKVSNQPTVSREIPAKTIYIQQYINYKEPDEATFQQKLVIYDEFYKRDAPRFFLISARADHYAYWLENSLVTNIVQEMGGIIYALEPRYHGDSHPTATTSTSDLQKLFTLDHLIMDYAILINTLKSQMEQSGETAKIILFGYDTGATLASWIYSLYYNMIDGVWASSAPMYPSAEFNLYFSDVQTTIANVNQNCHDHLENAFSEIKALVTDHKGSKISNYFNIGNDLDTHNTNDIFMFYYALLTGIGSIVEYANVDVVNDFCATFDDVTSENILEVFGDYFSELFDGDVLTYTNLVDLFKLDSWDSPTVINGERQQLFQSCSYLSWFRTSKIGSSSFFNVNLPLEFYTKICEDVFSITPEAITAGNVLTAATYKLRNNLPNMYFTNGELDPYRLVGVINQINTQGMINIIRNVGKAYDFRPTNEELDAQEVHDAKLNVKAFIESWIG